MVDLAPFRGLRYAEGVDLSQVTAPPYDAIDDDLADELRRRHRFNVVRLERGAGTGGGASGDGPDDPYERVAATYRTWLDDGVLEFDPTPRMYVYEQAFVERGRPHLQRGVFAALALRDWDSGEVMPHERIYRQPVEDRLRLLRALPANTSAVFGLAEHEPPEVTRALDRVARGPATAAFRDQDGVEHRMWVVADTTVLDAFTDGYRDVRLLMADGHHRYTTALEYRAGQPDAPGADRILMYVVGGDGPVVRPSHRVIHTPIDDVVERLRSAGLNVQVGSGERPGGAETVPDGGVAGPVDRAEALLGSARGPAFVLLSRDALGVRVALVTVAEEARANDLRAAADASEAARGLDVTLLHGLLREALGVDTASGTVSLTSDAREAVGAVAGGDASSAFLVRAVTVEQVRQVARAGGRMPPKSTSFHPKPRTGLVIRPLHGQPVSGG